MLTSFYLFLTPLLLVGVYISYKYIRHSKEIKNLETNAFIQEGEYIDNAEIAKEKVFGFFEAVWKNIFSIVIVFFHWLLHFFVLFLGLVSELVDKLYAKSRNFFLQSATKEKKAVSTFWHHLKEYKKEKEEEGKE
jgi:hypothetical protein